MIRVMVMAGDSVLVDGVGSLLVREICPDVLQLTYSLPRRFYGAIRDHRSMVIVIDEGASEHDALTAAETIQEAGPLLLIRVSMHTRDINVQKNFRLNDPGMEQVSKLVRDFNKTYLQKTNKQVVTWSI